MQRDNPGSGLFPVSIQSVLPLPASSCSSFRNQVERLLCQLQRYVSTIKASCSEVLTFVPSVTVVTSTCSRRSAALSTKIGGDAVSNLAIFCPPDCLASLTEADSTSQRYRSPPLSFSNLAPVSIGFAGDMHSLLTKTPSWQYPILSRGGRGPSRAKD